MLDNRRPRFADRHGPTLGANDCRAPAGTLPAIVGHGVPGSLVGELEENP